MIAGQPARRRSLWQRLRAILKSDSVRLYVWPYYIAICAWGLYGSIFALPNTVVEPVMGHAVYNLWVWLCVAGPALAMSGMLTRGAKGRYFGEFMQLGGNACVAFVLAAFEYSALVGTPWGRGSVVVFIIPPYILGCTFLALRNAVELYDAEWVEP